jgi:hypothetical protein
LTSIAPLNWSVSRNLTASPAKLFSNSGVQELHSVFCAALIGRNASRQSCGLPFIHAASSRVSASHFATLILPQPLATPLPNRAGRPTLRNAFCNT